MITVTFKPELHPTLKAESVIYIADRFRLARGTNLLLPGWVKQDANFQLLESTGAIVITADDGVDGSPPVKPRFELDANRDGVADVAANGGGGGGSLNWLDIQNKPTIPNRTSQLTNDTGFIANLTYNQAIAAIGYTPVNPSSLAPVALTGDYVGLINKPTIPTHTSDLVNDSNFGAITNANLIAALGYNPVNPANLAQVSFTGNYNDLSNRPAILTATSQLTNDTGFITGITSPQVVTALGYVPQDSSLLGSAAYKNTPATGDAGLTEVLTGSDTRLTDARSPIGNAGGDLTGSYPNPVLVNQPITAGVYQYATVGVDSKGRVISIAQNSVPIYESGSWTPTITGATTPPIGVVYTTRLGRYVRHGNQVMVICHVATSAGSGGTGQMRITGLPYVAAEVSGSAPILMSTAANVNYGGVIPIGASYVEVFVVDNTFSIFIVSGFNGARRLQFTINYYI